MIIFDLDGTLADCKHRRHFVDYPKKHNAKFIFTDSIPHENGCILTGNYKLPNQEKWKPDWQAFYEACDRDQVIPHSTELLYLFLKDNYPLEIWSGRCESVRDKTQDWLDYNIFYHYFGPEKKNINLKMRPIGDSTPDDVLKEKWLDEALAEGKKIDFVFDDRPKVIRMWRRRGIFVFNCCQHEEEF